ncbi:hypothetical protein DL96DRAFT_1722236 [Flagelloscypha sp. PMI_526]|nr:hypothetical protein DL96DRAFT_1722236 [Flagelloscypha sp. PMI_526]
MLIHQFSNLELFEPSRVSEGIRSAYIYLLHLACLAASSSNLETQHFPIKAIEQCEESSATHPLQRALLGDLLYAFHLSIFRFLIVVTVFLASPTAKTPKKSSTGTSGRYIVSLTPNAQRGTVKSKHGIVSSSAHDWNIINAFVIEGNNKTALDALFNDPDVETVEEGGIASGAIEQIQRNAP